MSEEKGQADVWDEHDMEESTVMFFLNLPHLFIDTVSVVMYMQMSTNLKSYTRALDTDLLDKWIKFATAAFKDVYKLPSILSRILDIDADETGAVVQTLNNLADVTADRYRELLWDWDELQFASDNENLDVMFDIKLYETGYPLVEKTYLPILVSWFQCAYVIYEAQGLVVIKVVSDWKSATVRTLDRKSTNDLTFLLMDIVPIVQIILFRFHMFDASLLTFLLPIRDKKKCEEIYTNVRTLLMTLWTLHRRMNRLLTRTIGILHERAVKKNASKYIEDPVLAPYFSEFFAAMDRETILGLLNSGVSRNATTALVMSIQNVSKAFTVFVHEGIITEPSKVTSEYETVRELYGAGAM